MTDDAVETKPDLWGEAPPLGPIRLIGAGMGLVRANLPAIGALILVAVAATAAVRIGARSMGVSVAGVELDPAYFAYEALTALATAVVAGLMLRAMLAEGAARWRLDTGFAAYVALTAAAAFAGVLLTGLLTADDPQGLLATALRFTAGLIATAAMIYVFTKLMLWPIGLLMGEPGLTPRRSWTLMHRAGWGYIAAVALLFLAALPFYIVLLIPGGGDADIAPAPLLVAEHAVTAVWTALTAAVAAAVYRARVMGQGV